MVDGVRNGFGAPGRRGRPRSWAYTAGTVARIDLRLPHHPRSGSPLLRCARYNRSQARAHPASAAARQLPSITRITRPIHTTPLLTYYLPPPSPAAVRRIRSGCQQRAPRADARVAMGRLPGNKSRAEARSLGDNVVSGTRTRRRSQEHSPISPVPLPHLCCSLLPQCCANAQAAAHLPPPLAPLRSSRTRLRRGPPYAPASRHPPACPPSNLLPCLPTMVMRRTWECQIHKSSRPCSLPSQGAHPPRPVPWCNGLT